MSRVGNVLALLLLCLAVGCGDDPTGPERLPLGELVGSWEAVSFVLSAGGVGVDMVELGGANHVDIEADGRITVATREPGTTLFTTETGTVEVVRVGVMRLAIDTPVELSYTVSATELTFSGPGEADLDGDGDDEPVTVSGVFRRR